MTEIMSPSTKITESQIGKIQELLGAGLRKSGLQSKPTQIVIEQQGKSLIEELIAVVRTHVEAISTLIVRNVNVNRNRKPKEVLTATGRNQYTNDDVVNCMPHGDGETAEVIFFRVGRFVNDADLEKEYELRGLKAADPYSLAAINEADPVFADTHPNGTHWKDAGGNWCYAAFDRWDGVGRDVSVHRRDRGWGDDWWFAGVRK